MAKVIPGRWTAEVEGPFVVFIIGMRVNNLLAVNKWVPVARSMGDMLKALYTDKSKGFLGGQTVFYWRGIGMVQYWRSFDQLEHFARNNDDPHMPTWRWYNRAVAAGGMVGIWHETYTVNEGGYEAVYGNMPAWGLASAFDHVKATGRRETARRRLGGDNDPAVATPE